MAPGGGERLEMGWEWQEDLFWAGIWVDFVQRGSRLLLSQKSPTRRIRTLGPLATTRPLVLLVHLEIPFRGEQILLGFEQPPDEWSEQL